MKSICIKTNNSKIIDYLLDNFQSLNLSNVYISTSTFKVYQNIIAHYKGDNLDSFINYIASILTNTILIFYEDKLINNILNNEFFYFTSFEKNSIKSLALSSNISDTANYYYNYNYIFNELSSYISENKSLILNGFVTFRLKNYINSLENLVSYSVCKFLTL